MVVCTLFELHEFIRRVLALNFPDPLWVSGEVSQVNLSRGHYFLELVQKAESGDEIIAQGEAVIWERTARQLRRRLGATFDALLQDGLELRLQARVDFNERYGLKLIIEDIDTDYTMGRLELLRRQTMAKLSQLGLLERNTSLPLPPVIQRIAVLTSETAAGLQDYLSHLESNAYGYRFENRLFPAAVQGRQVEPEMLRQLEGIRRQQADFDCVVIIRGGGARLDLAAFDSFELSRAVATFPLPVLTGIGHDVDQTVLDLVSHTSLKTPTAVADFLIARNLQFETAVGELAYRLQLDSQRLLRRHQLLLNQLEQLLHAPLRPRLTMENLRIGTLETELLRLARRPLRDQGRLLDQLDLMAWLLSPEATLRRGFTLTLYQGKTVTAAGGLTPGDELITIFQDGKAVSTVKKMEI